MVRITVIMTFLVFQDVLECGVNKHRTCQTVANNIEYANAFAYERIYTNRMDIMVYNDYLGVVKTLVHSGQIFSSSL